jgi:hypothetical protein
MITIEMCNAFAAFLLAQAAGPVEELGIGFEPTDREVRERRWALEAAARHVRNVIAKRVARRRDPRRLYRDKWARAILHKNAETMGLR